MVAHKNPVAMLRLLLTAVYSLNRSLRSYFAFAGRCLNGTLKAKRLYLTNVKDMVYLQLSSKQGG